MVIPRLRLLASDPVELPWLPSDDQWARRAESLGPPNGRLDPQRRSSLPSERFAPSPPGEEPESHARWSITLSRPTWQTWVGFRSADTGGPNGRSSRDSDNPTAAPTDGAANQCKSVIVGSPRAQRPSNDRIGVS